MKPQFIRVPSDEAFSFRIINEVVPYFYNPLHFHPELELAYVIQGKGTRFIGYHVEPFFPDDLVLVGSNLPHCWKNDAEYYDETSLLKAQAIVVQFREDFAGPSFFELPELLPIKGLFLEAKRGLKIYGDTKKKIRGKLQILVNHKGADRISSLLDILAIIASSAEKVQLTETDPYRLIPSIQMKRLNDIYQYTLDHFRENIRLEDIAQVANMTPNAFCRFFKHHNQKTYGRFINEIRISHACQLLRGTAAGITQIAYESGFNNQSHFNKVFKKHKKMIPFDYRKQQTAIS